MPEVFPTNVPNETWLQFVREASATKREIDEASGRHRSVMKRAKAAGCNPKVIALAITSKKQDPAVVASEIRDTVRVMNLVGVELTPGNLFGTWEPSVTEKAAEEFDLHTSEERGYAAGKGGQDRAGNPFEVGSPFHQSWDNGWIRGQKFIADSMGPDKVQANASRKRPERTPEAKTAPKAATRRGRGRPRKDQAGAAAY